MVQRPIPITSRTSVTTPRLLGRYHVLDELGRNAIGPVYLGRLEGPQGFQRWAAIRTLDGEKARDGAFRKLFFERAREGAKLLHPNVATIFDVGEDENAAWSASEYLHGERLSEVIDRIEIADTPMSWEIAARIVTEIAEGLQAIHVLPTPDGSRRVHGRLAPNSFIVTYEGIGKVKGAFEPRRGEPDRRSVPYTPPELLFGGDVPTVATDVFALGTILWELANGRHLFARTTDDETRAMIEAGLVPSVLERVPGAPKELDAIVAKALARRPEQRYGSARELGRALEDLLYAKRQRVRQEDVGRYLRTLFADRYLEQEGKLKEAADVTEVYRRSQHGMRSALPNLAPREEDDDDDGDATTVMPSALADDEDRTTAERPAATSSGLRPPPRPGSHYPPSPESSPTQVRPPARDALGDSSTLPTLVRPSDRPPALLPLTTLPLSNQLRTAPIPALTPSRSSSGFLSEPSVTPSTTDFPAAPVSEGSAVFVAPRAPLSSDSGGDTTTALRRPSSAPPPPRLGTPAPPTLHLRTQQTLSANDESVVAPPPRPIPVAPPTIPRASPDERTLTNHDALSALPSTGKMPVAAPVTSPIRRVNPDERTLTAYDAPPALGPSHPVGYPAVGSSTALRAIPGSPPDPRSGRKQIATVAVIGVGGGVILFLILLFALRTPESPKTPTFTTSGSAALSARAPTGTVTVTAPTKATASAVPPTPPPPPTATTLPPGTIPTTDVNHLPTSNPTTRPTTRPTARPTSPPPPPPTTPVVAGGKGFLTVMCRPSSCDQVLDNGQNLGETPLAKIPLSVGKHVLTLRVNSPRAEKVVPVLIQDGETTKINQDMSQ